MVGYYYFAVFYLPVGTAFHGTDDIGEILFLPRGQASSQHASGICQTLHPDTGAGSIEVG